MNDRHLWLLEQVISTVGKFTFTGYKGSLVNIGCLLIQEFLWRSECQWESGFQVTDSSLASIANVAGNSCIAVAIRKLEFLSTL